MLWLWLSLDKGLDSAMALAKHRQGLGLVLGLWLSLDKGLD